MLLKELNEKESQAFLKLATEFISVDGNIDVKEKQIIDRYSKALNITNAVNSMEVDDAKKVLVEASERVKNIVYFELLGLALVDGEYENTEIDFLEDLSNAFGIDRASKFRYANFYYDIDKIKDLSEEELDEKLKNIVR